MPDQLMDKKGLLTSIGEVVSQVQGLLSSLDEPAINQLPFPASWTAGQLVRHVVKSISGIAKVMRLEANPAQRDVGERVGELKKIFLDFSLKMQSPNFILPEAGPYSELAIGEELTKSVDELTQATTQANLNDLVDNPALGELTKWEMLHFVWYHTQRHLHQLKTICEAL